MNTLARQCEINGCPRQHLARGLCNMHYLRLKTRGHVGGTSPVRIIHKHGLKGHELYQAWCQMKDRCSNPNAHHYKNYGGRGIKVCERWMDFSVFLKDVGERPVGMTLDRIDNDGDYEPSNCRWASQSGQLANSRQPVGACGYRGVHRQGRRYAARVKWQGKWFNTPTVDTIEEAAHLRDQWAIALHGEYARLNFN